jgi:hypothetical protein
MSKRTHNGEVFMSVRLSFHKLLLRNCNKLLQNDSSCSLNNTSFTGEDLSALNTTMTSDLFSQFTTRRSSFDVRRGIENREGSVNAGGHRAQV